MIFSNVSMLVPYTSDKKEREANWNWLKKRYEILMPNVEICIGECSSYPYSRAEAINNAAKKATREIFIITDADLLFNIEDIRLCINMLKQYKIVYVISKLIKLEGFICKEIISKSNDIPIKDMNISSQNSYLVYDKSKPNEYSATGGICVTSKTSFKECGGFDERFRGWGGEDNAFATINKYLYKKSGRPDNVIIYHFYHEKQPIIQEYYEVNSKIIREEYWQCKNLQKTLDYLKSQNKFED